MARDGAGVYSLPAGTAATPNTTIESAKYNAFIADVASDLNTARPISAGGTGATTAAAARTALGITDTTSLLLNQTGLNIKGTNDFALQIKPNETYTANRTLNLTTGNANRNLSLGGDVSLASALSTVGAFAVTLNTTALTNVTLPVTGTLATLDGSETLNNKVLINPSMNQIGTGSGILSLPGSVTDTIVTRANADTLSNKTLTNPTINAATLTGAFAGTPTFTGALVSFNGSISLIGSLALVSASAGVELGSTAAAGTPFLDFHSSGNSIDYDARIIAAGGSGSIGNGGLTYTAASHAFSSRPTFNSNTAWDAGNLPATSFTTSLVAGADAATWRSNIKTMHYFGVYAGGTTYRLNAIVNYTGATYTGLHISLQDSNVGHTPPDNSTPTAYWSPMNLTANASATAGGGGPGP